MPKIAYLFDTTKGRILLDLPGVENLPTNAEFYPLNRPPRYGDILPDAIEHGKRQYVGILKAVSPLYQHFTATLLEIGDERTTCTNGHEFIVTPQERPEREYDIPQHSVFHSLIVFVENADDALYRTQKEAEYILEGLRAGNVWSALETLFSKKGYTT